MAADVSNGDYRGLRWAARTALVSAALAILAALAHGRARVHTEGAPARSARLRWPTPAAGAELALGCP
ncbi:hypothetical protein [Streptomyces dysideae]|uniref:Uncharacterized protein n=1 Tax=Streptomyces dysideae TaxID=909626 RepID=A0A117RXH7_9ACTN|nr:hypothetical protein [Streptomyces dysideae]KUO15137.1 hypothetical protein AQJ91_43250 [Streptomyces dysideae]